MNSQSEDDKDAHDLMPPASAQSADSQGSPAQSQTSDTADSLPPNVRMREVDARTDAAETAGETVSQVGAATGEFPGEQLAARREREAASTGKHAFLIGAGILLSRIIGLVRQRVFAYYFGTSAAKDAFDAAFKIPNFLQNVFGEGALSASFIPVYANLLARNDEKEAGRLAGAIFTILALVTSTFVLLGVLTAPYITRFIAIGFEGERYDLTVRLVKIFFPGAGLLVLSAWCLGVLNSHRRFFLSYTAPVIWNLAIIAALVIFGGRVEQFPLAEYAAWGSVVGSGLQFGVQLPTVLRLVKRLRPALDLASTHVRTVLRNFFPVFISRGVVQISAFVDSQLASLLPVGAVGAISFAQSIYTLPVSLFGMSVSAAELPAMASTLGEQGEVAAHLRKRLEAGLRQIAFFVVPSSMAFLALGDVIVGVLYQTGRFTREDSQYVWAILAGSTVGLLASTLGRLYSSTYYALHDTRTPLRYAVLRVALATMLGYFCALRLAPALGFDARWGAAGLTAASGLAGWVEFYLLRRTLNRRIGRTGVPSIFLAKVWLAAGFSAAVGWAFKIAFDNHQPFVAALLVLVPYGLIYFAVTSVMGLPEAKTLLGRVARLRRRKR